MKRPAFGFESPFDDEPQHHSRTLRSVLSAIVGSVIWLVGVL